MAVSEHSALFSLLGTTYGGDGRTTFGLPDLRGRAPVHVGNGPGLSSIREGGKGGAEEVTLSVDNLGNHTHEGYVTVRGSSAPADTDSPVDGLLAVTQEDSYASSASDVSMSVNSVEPGGVTVQSTGAGAPVFIRDPGLAMNYIIALAGTYPSRD